MAVNSSLFLATIYNQLQLVERKHVARYWSNDTAATAIPLSPHPCHYKISGGHIRLGVVRRKCSAGSVLPLWVKVSQNAPEHRSGARKFKCGVFRLPSYCISQTEPTFPGPAASGINSNPIVNESFKFHIFTIIKC